MDWLSGDVRPFTELEDKGFRGLTDALIGARKHLKIPHEGWARKQVRVKAEITRGDYQDFFKACAMVSNPLS